MFTALTLPAPFSWQPIPDPLPDMRTVVTEVLAATGYEGKRAAQLGLDDFLAYVTVVSGAPRSGLLGSLRVLWVSRLLEAFNKAGLHFA